MKAGDVLFNGKVVNSNDAARYNRIDDRIKSFNGPVPEHLINSRHKMFMLISLSK